MNDPWTWTKGRECGWEGRVERNKGGKWDNGNSIINKTYFLKEFKWIFIALNYLKIGIKINFREGQEKNSKNIWRKKTWFLTRSKNIIYKECEWHRNRIENPEIDPSGEKKVVYLMNGADNLLRRKIDRDSLLHIVMKNSTWIKGLK